MNKLKNMHYAAPVATSLVVLVVPLITDAAAFGNPLAFAYIQDILRAFILGVIYIGMPALAVFIVWTGFLFISAQGNDQGLTKAKQMAVRVSIGGFILLALWVLVRVVGNTLAGLSAASLLILLSAFLLYTLYNKR
tara:strand:+ start:7414 stop:7821 length:408 start_codon:yes stop_codon:yes gene_type:complete